MDKMKNFIVYNKDGKILRTGRCPEVDFPLQVQENEFVIEGKANDAEQKIQFDGLSETGKPINPQIVDKSPEEIEANQSSKSLPIPEKKQSAHITKGQWQAVLDRLKVLEDLQK